MIQSDRLRPYFLLLLLTGAIVLMALIFWPFLKPLALAMVFAVVLQGLYRRIARFLGSWPSTAALLTVLVSLLFILLPISLIAVMVGNQARDLYVSLEAGGGPLLAGFSTQLEQALEGAVPGAGAYAQGLSADMSTYAQGALRWVASHAGQIFSSVSSLLLSTFIFFIALYYLLRDGKRVRQTLIELSPLSDTEDAEVFEKLELAVNSVIKGNLVIAVLQGILTTIGLTLFGVPNSVLWGTLAAMAALIPGVGTSLIFIPAIAFLFFTGAAPQAFGLLLWGVLAVGLIDNMLGPKLVGSRMSLHPLLVLLSVLGGIMFFGPIGIFLGPLSLALLFALLSIYASISKPA